VNKDKAFELKTFYINQIGIHLEFKYKSQNQNRIEMNTIIMKLEDIGQAPN